MASQNPGKCTPRRIGIQRATWKCRRFLPQSSQNAKDPCCIGMTTMKIEFRPLAREEVREAVAGELHVRPLNPRYDAALACGALELGVEGFVQGALPIRT